MIKKACLSASVCCAILLSACDNTAKTTSLDHSKTTAQSNAPIRIGYSDWPGWVAWQVAIEKGWFKDAGLNVEFKWFDYSASISAFSANQLDAVTVSNGDSLLIASGGTQSVMILATDYSAGNDVIIAKNGIHSVADLKGKSIAIEKGLVDHLLLATALQDANIATSEVHLVNAMSNELPQVFSSPSVDAIAVWQPVANQALNVVAGAKVIYSSKDKPGLIYDTLTVNMNHLSANKEQWGKIIQVWDKTVKYINDPKTHADAVKIMAKKVGIAPQQYEQFIAGTHLLDVEANQNVFRKGTDFNSIYGSSYHVNRFNVSQGVYKTEQNVDALIYPALINAAK